MSIASELAAGELRHRTAEGKRIEERRYREQRLSEKTFSSWNRIWDSLRRMTAEYNEAFPEPAVTITSPQEENCGLEIVKYGRVERTTRVHLSAADPPSIEFSIARGKAPPPPNMQALFVFDLDSEGGMCIEDFRKAEERVRVTETNVAEELLRIALR